MTRIILPVEGVQLVNLISLTLVIMLWVVNYSNYRQKTRDYCIISAISNMILLSVGLNIIINMLNGCPGKRVRLAIMILRSVVLFCAIMNGMLENIFVQKHLGITGWNAYLPTFIVPAVAFILILVNFRKPIFFYVNERNELSRESWGDLFLTLMLIYGILSIIAYYVARRENVVVKFFPVWTFAIPLMLGAVIQFFFYGIHILLIFQAISLTCMVAALKNEYIYIDSLTGAYNRRYLAYLKEHLPRQVGKYYGIMIDVNGFKHINDLYGHDEGDIALQEVVWILRKAIGDSSVIIRFAGDEFVAFVGQQRSSEFAGFIRKIDEEFNRYNLRSGKKYKLTVSSGGSEFDPNTDDFADFIKRIDAEMYEDKKAFYELHDNDRRK